MRFSSLIKLFAATWKLHFVTVAVCHKPVFFCWCAFKCSFKEKVVTNQTTGRFITEDFINFLTLIIHFHIQRHPFLMSPRTYRIDFPLRITIVTCVMHVCTSNCKTGCLSKVDPCINNPGDEPGYNQQKKKNPSSFQVQRS